jgi:hypothetical protein
VCFAKKKRKEEECHHVKNNFKFSVFKWWLSCTCASLSFFFYMEYSDTHHSAFGRTLEGKALEEPCKNPE